jgi:hypothetical protein
VIGVQSFWTAKVTGDGIEFDLFKRNGFGTRAAADQIEGSIDRGARQVSLRVWRPIVVCLTFDEPEEDSLEYVFGVGGTTGNALRGPKNSTVVRPEKRFQFGGGFVCH